MARISSIPAMRAPTSLPFAVNCWPVCRRRCLSTQPPYLPVLQGNLCRGEVGAIKMSCVDLLGAGPLGGQRQGGVENGYDGSWHDSSPKVRVTTRVGEKIGWLSGQEKALQILPSGGSRDDQIAGGPRSFRFCP